MLSHRLHVLRRKRRLRLSPRLSPHHPSRHGPHRSDRTSPHRTPLPLRLCRRPAHRVPFRPPSIPRLLHNPARAARYDGVCNTRPPWPFQHLRPHPPLPRPLPRNIRLLRRHHHHHNLDAEQPSLGQRKRHRRGGHECHRPNRAPPGHFRLPHARRTLLRVWDEHLRLLHVVGSAAGGRAALASRPPQCRDDDTGRVRQHWRETAVEVRIHVVGSLAPTHVPSIRLRHRASWTLAMLVVRDVGMRPVAGVAQHSTAQHSMA